MPNPLTFARVRELRNAGTLSFDEHEALLLIAEAYFSAPTAEVVELDGTGPSMIVKCEASKGHGSLFGPLLFQRVRLVRE